MQALDIGSLVCGCTGSGYEGVGSRIREIRTNKGLTQVQLAMLCGTKQQAIHLYEAGQRSPSLEVLEKIAKALRVDLKELF